MCAHHLVYRSYGGENLKNRPDFYTKALTLASFVYAASRVPDADVVFVNNGPVPSDRLALMEAFGRVVQIDEGPVGLLDSYRFSLGLPDREGWADDDVVSYNEDDYLFHPDAFVALVEATRELSHVAYFALSGESPLDDSPAARLKFRLPRDWQPQPPQIVGERAWFNLGSTTSTFSGRVAALRADMSVFLQCTRPFKRRYLDHETCLIYQGVAPYRGRQILLGLPGELHPTLRGVARTAFLVPYRVALNARAHRQTERHLLYAPTTALSAHLECGLVGADQDWVAVADDVAEWAGSVGFSDVAARIRSRLVAS